MKLPAQLVTLLLAVTLLSNCNKTEADELTPVTANGQHKSLINGDLPNNNYNPLAQLGINRLYYQSQMYTLIFKRLYDAAPDVPRDLTTDQLFIYDRQPVTGSARQLLPIARQMAQQGQSVVLEAVVIKFRAGVTPRQFYSATEVYDASKGSQPDITLEPTGVFFRGGTYSNTAQTGGDVNIGG